MAQAKGTSVDMDKYVIKPSDIGYQTEVAAEMTPTATRQTYGRMANQQQSTSSTRPPLMIYPGE